MCIRDSLVGRNPLVLDQPPLKGRSQGVYRRGLPVEERLQPEGEPDQQRVGSTPVSTADSGHRSRTSNMNGRRRTLAAMSPGTPAKRGGEVATTISCGPAVRDAQVPDSMNEK